MPPTEPVCPKDCAVVVALPLSEAEFAADLAVSEEQDFAASLMRAFPEHEPGQVWDAFAGPLLRRVAGLLDSMAACGAEVVEHAGLAALASALAQYKVVVLVTHWRPPWVRSEQIVDPSAVGAALHTLGLRALEPKRHLERLGPRDLTEALNYLLAHSNLGPSSAPVAWHSDVQPEPYKLYANREALQLKLAGAIKEAPPIEFRDGMRTVAELESAIPPGFDGCLDLTVCNSMVAVDILKRTRRFSCLGNEEETLVDFRLEICAEVLRALGRAPRPYPDAMLDIRLAVAAALEAC